MIKASYRAQVDLLLRILPAVAKEKTFALKGGTAINLFVLDMPRLSVDIDLTYVAIVDNRETALKNISEALDRIEAEIRKTVKGISITRVPQGQGEDVKLNCQMANARVKIEVNTVTRGIIMPVRMMQVTEGVEKAFEKFAAMGVVSHGELYGGKICAALDRQHPRDLFDVHGLFEREGFSEEVRLGSLIFLLSHYRPMHELIGPNFSDQRKAFELQFAGMSEMEFTYEMFEQARKKLVTTFQKSLTDNEKKFLLSFKAGEPVWDLVPLKQASDLPAVNWKLMNIRNLKAGNAARHAGQLKAFEDALGKIA